eukprot:3759672-Rhodomonas_salina.1
MSTSSLLRAEVLVVIHEDLTHQVQKLSKLSLLPHSSIAVRTLSMRSCSRICTCKDTRPCSLACCTSFTLTLRSEARCRACRDSDACTEIRVLKHPVLTLARDSTSSHLFPLPGKAQRCSAEACDTAASSPILLLRCGGISYTPKSNTRNRIFSTICTRNAVSCI